MLKSVIEWIGRSLDKDIDFDRPDLTRKPNPPKKIEGKIIAAFEMSPCDILCVHRDANARGLEKRKTEIEIGIRKAQEKQNLPPLCVPVIPVKETEAWPLIDKDAICKAASAEASCDIQPPKIRDIESISNPKEILYGLLKQASGITSPRRLKKFNPGKNAHRVAELIQDYSPLRQLSAFQKFETDFKEALGKLNNL